MKIEININSTHSGRDEHNSRISATSVLEGDVTTEELLTQFYHLLGAIGYGHGAIVHGLQDLLEELE